MSSTFSSDDSLTDSPGSPSIPDTLHSMTAFARFEFEHGKGNEGTKILMVEFEDGDAARDPGGSYQVSWSGKTTVLAADDRTPDNNRRLYFLLPPGTSIPPKILLTYSSPTAAGSSSSSEPLRMTLNPLPAIFAPDLGVSARTSGKKGVLHTIWAKKRLQVLDKEIKREEEYNLEGIALNLARSEKEWIENNFGVFSQRPPTLDLTSLSRSGLGVPSPVAMTPRSPGGRKLSEKLKGLTLGTSDKDLRNNQANTPSHESHPLSPEHDDVAYSSFHSFNVGAAPSSSASKTSRITAQFPPDAIKSQQTTSPTASLDYVTEQKSKDAGDDLFAKSLSPRSPNGPKSPFSLSATETLTPTSVKSD